MKKCRFIAPAAFLTVAGVTLVVCHGQTELSEKARLTSAETTPVARFLRSDNSHTVRASCASTLQTPTARGTLPFVLTSKTPFTKSLRLAAEAIGARTADVLSRNALLVEADVATRARLSADGRFASVTEHLPGDKIDPKLAALVARGAKTADIAIVSLSPEDRQRVIACLKTGGGDMLTGCINEGAVVRATVPASLVDELAMRGDVRWMESFSRPKLTNGNAVEPKAMNVREVWDAHGLTGAGQKITTSDSGIDTGDTAPIHVDLRNRVKGMYFVDGCDHYDRNGHGTHTAGSLVGDGTASDGRHRGTAFGADLYAWFCGVGTKDIYLPDTLDDLFRPGNVDAYIHSGSWGGDATGEYTVFCAEFDNYAWENPEYLPVLAAGNEGSGASTVALPATAKNVLAVGATQNLPGDPTSTAGFSSRGPCADGRIKPDIASPGSSITSTRSAKADGSVANAYTSNSGTSMACPLTAGAVALVRQWLVERKGFADVDGRRPTAALMKAVITGGAKDAPVPNNAQGWGRVDLAETLFPSNRAVRLVDRIPFEQDFVTNIVIVTTNAAPLDVQLVWVDYPGSSSASQSTPKLVNDLDLSVRTQDEETLLYGNGGSEPDEVNNVESVRIAQAAATEYVITVTCKTILHDYTEGGAAALYIRGAFDPEVDTPYEELKTETVNGLVWRFTVSDGKATVGGRTVRAIPTTAGAIAIPSVLGGCPVVGIAPRAFSDCDALTCVTIPSSVTNVGSSAFANCGEVTNVVLRGHAPKASADAFSGVSAACRAMVFEGTSGWDDDGDGKWAGMTLACRAIFPDIGKEPTESQIAKTLSVAADPKLATCITNGANYGAFRTWAGQVKDAGGQPAGMLAVVNSSTAWLSYALDSETLIAKEPRDGDMKVKAFEPTAEGALSFTLGIEHVTVGDHAMAENLAKVFGIKGGASLDSLTEDGVIIKSAKPENGDVKYTVEPKDESASYFIRVRDKLRER